MSASRKRSGSTLSSSSSTLNTDTALVENIDDVLVETERALYHVNQTIEDMTNQLRDLNKKKAKRFFDQTVRQEINVQGTTLHICTVDLFAPRMRTPTAGTPRNAATLFAVQQAQARVEGLRRLVHAGERQIDELGLELDGVALASPTPPSSPRFN